MVRAPDIRSTGSNPIRSGIQIMTTALHCTGPFIITLPPSRYDLNNVERDVKHQTTIIVLSRAVC